MKNLFIVKTAGPFAPSRVVTCKKKILLVELQTTGGFILCLFSMLQPKNDIHRISFSLLYQYSRKLLLVVTLERNVFTINAHPSVASFQRKKCFIHFSCFYIAFYLVTRDVSCENKDQTLRSNHHKGYQRFSQIHLELFFFNENFVA